MSAVASGALMGNATRAEVIWLAVGFTAQMMFAMRFVIQWIYTERARESVVPEAFWYFSLIGGLMLLTYAVYRGDPVFILGQAMGLVVYSRNLYFIRTRKAALRAVTGEE
jgi:lipid-A-disaccharide synthase-like uncharacterized protein